MKIFLKKHKYKFIIIPLILFIITSSEYVYKPALLSLTTEQNPYVSLADNLVTNIKISAESPVNVVGATIKFPKDKLEVIFLSKKDSILDLWAEEPIFSNEKGFIHFGGGTLRSGGFTGEGNILIITFKPKSTGTAKIRIEDSVVLAHDGMGTNVLAKTEGINYFIRLPQNPSPDLNNDGKINIDDITILYQNYSANNPRYDLNRNGAIGFDDLGILLFEMLK